MQTHTRGRRNEIRNGLAAKEYSSYMKKKIKMCKSRNIQRWITSAKLKIVEKKFKIVTAKKGITWRNRY